MGRIAARLGTDMAIRKLKPKPGQKTHAIMINKEITYGEFAAQHGTDIKRLNELNGLDLTATTPLAKGSEIYVPGQP